MLSQSVKSVKYVANVLLLPWIQMNALVSGAAKAPASAALFFVLSVCWRGLATNTLVLGSPAASKLNGGKTDLFGITH